MRFRVYIASNIERARWVDCVVATMLEARGCEIVSTWHRPPYATPEVERALTDEDAARIYATNMRDLSRAEACVVFAHEKGGEHLAEAAVAFHAAMPIVWEGRLILTARQPGVRRVAGLAEAIDAVANLAERRSRPSWLPPARTVSP